MAWTLITRAALVLAFAATATACLRSLPTAPSELVTGIIVYEHRNFRGRSAHVTRDIRDLKDFRGPCRHVSGGGFGPDVVTIERDWNDCISSVRVAPGWRATLYRDANYRDDSITTSEDIPDLEEVTHNCPRGGLDDCISSVRVEQVF
jgi:hypothetical protein